MEKVLDSIKQKSSPEDLAASIQVATEIIITDWIKQLMKCYKVSYIGMSGGVFSNVKLNQAVAGIEGIQDLFIFPPMGDEGLCVGNIISFLIKTEGLENISQYRQKMQIPYYGKKYTKKEILDAVPNEFFIYKEDDYIKKSAMLLQQYVGAIFFSGMEAGPRALGARSMLASPADRKINENLNQRLNRTEFMPFAPYVRDIDAKDIFSIKDSMETACKFMTITTNVKEKYIDTIPAVVHVDKTARPQIIQREDNYLYYDILTEFKNLTSLPVLINTSFNAHEEPIINRPEEAFESLLDNRIDFLIFEGFLVLPKEIAKEITKS
ncbi:MAG TPA: hypothetical protein EYG75_00390 [Campylobacterales bacterium]|nr:hypothetical protein [Campylobacterales bacterium]